MDAQSWALLLIVIGVIGLIVLYKGRRPKSGPPT
jgi:hypothetical protein